RTRRGGVDSHLRCGVFQGQFEFMDRRLSAYIGEIRAIGPPTPMNHVARGALPGPEKELLARSAIPDRFCIKRGNVQGTHPACKRLDLALGQREGRHASWHAVADYVRNLAVAPAA